MLVCSAFKRSYGAYHGTLIGNLYEKKGISVEAEAANPAIDCREQYNYWISRELDASFKRIGCIELLDLSENGKESLKELSESFSTLYELLIHMEKLGNAPGKVILPILGSGNQGIELCYIVPPLLIQCVKALEDIEQLEKITFCEYDRNKAKTLIKLLKSTEHKNKNVCDVFISYCSAQRNYADCLRNMLNDKGIKCWMAPYSIPAGSSYQSEIPAALSNISNVLLILSKEAEASRWVQKEIGCAIGSRHKLIPFRSNNYEISSQFSFLLDGEQIFDVDKNLSDEDKCKEVVNYLVTLLNSESAKEPFFEKESIHTKPAKKSGARSLRDVLIIGIGLTIVAELMVIIKRMR